MNARAVSSRWPRLHAFCMEWNPENQLTRVTKNTIEQARFKYDPLGRRVEKVAGATTTTWAYDGEDILREVSGSTIVKYVHGLDIDEPLATDDGSTLAYSQADGLGSVVKTTSSTGSVTMTRQYDAWGSLQAGGTTSGYAFTGREWDQETGLHYYRFRYYDPKLGRFLSEDPIGFAGGSIHLYAYVGNNPTNYLDAYGLYPRRGMPDWSPERFCAVQKFFKYIGTAFSGNPRYAHCMASCEIAKECGGPEFAEQAATSKEWLDVVTCIGGYGKGCKSAFEPVDADDNATGRTCPANQDCADRCRRLDHAPNGSPGDFANGPAPPWPFN